MSKRAERRRHLARMKAKAKRVYPTWERAKYWANHLHGCSCNMCCNVRSNPWTKGEWTYREWEAEIKLEEGISGLHSDD